MCSKNSSLPAEIPQKTSLDYPFKEWKLDASNEDSKHVCTAGRASPHDMATPGHTFTSPSLGLALALWESCKSRDGRETPTTTNITLIITFAEPKCWVSLFCKHICIIQGNVQNNLFRIVPFQAVYIVRKQLTWLEIWGWQLCVQVRGQGRGDALHLMSDPCRHDHDIEDHLVEYFQCAEVACFFNRHVC